MRLDDFNYPLPKELIARHPLSQRRDSRLLCLGEQLDHYQFKDFLSLLQENDLLVFNNSRVIPARLFGNKSSGGKVEILIERIQGKYSALAHLKANKAVKIGSKLNLKKEQTDVLVQPLSQAFIADRQNDLFVLHFSQPVFSVLEQYGHIPLPPYINRHDEQTDIDRYQTVYAQADGSVAAPTAGLHFDQEMLDQVKRRGIDTAFVTLHIGAGTFQPVRVDDIHQHRMHSEWIEVSTMVCDKISTTKRKGGRIIAIGTTTMRCLETANGRPYHGETDIFITPGYQFNTVDLLLTNFHLPKSTLLMLVAAFGGYSQIMDAYHVAIAEKYRFYSYGDAMLINRLKN